MTGEADIAAQFAAFVHAPIPYIAEAVLVAGVAWAVSRTFTRDTMDALLERLNLATDRLRKANEEANAIREKLAAVQIHSRDKESASQFESATAAVQADVVALMRASNDTLGTLAKPLRRSVSIPSGRENIAPISSKGPGSKPEARRQELRLIG